MCFELFSSNSRISEFRAKTKPLLILHSQQNLNCLKSGIDHSNRRENQALAGVIPYSGEHPGPPFEDKFRLANQMDGISKAGEIRWLSVKL